MAFPGTPSLSDALAKHQIDLPTDQVARIDRYCQLLWSWNERINLTRHTDYDTFVTRDVVDSLELAKLLEPGEEVLDVGSGGGVPGILLAIVRPDLQVTMCDSVRKKVQVLAEIATELGLATPVFAERGESLLEDMRVDSVIARAIGPLWKVCQWFAPHWMSMRRLLLIKGPRWVDERKEARERGVLRAMDLRRVASYPMAGTASESVILQLTLKKAGSD
ncbi:MAG: 16S rRNA (guanine(527)-N(7))-methyltransferase RsmG [Planctomycetes bacterium]|nr:16S rRNA (guanine(527)-N(7))-methyltransferase RsmG [Planctomycetota bacterium]